MFKKIAAALVLLAAGSGVFAAEPMPLYAGLDASSTKVDGFDREGGYGAFIGYTFTPGVAVEAGYHRLLDSDYRIGTASGTFTLDQFDVSVVGSIPLSSGFSLLGRLGYNRLEADDNGLNFSQHDSGSVVGLGLGYVFSPQISGRLEVQRPGSDITKISAGVAFHF